MKDFLGIIGGIGPLSSAYFYTKLVLATKVNCDQDNIDMVILNHASIPDRTDYILSKSTLSPLPDLIADVKWLDQSGAKLITILCNTACYFYDELVRHTNVPILNIVEETVKYLSRKNVETVGLLATTGTVEAQLYQKACEKYNINCIVPDEVLQERVMDIIYNKVKKGKIPTREEFYDVIDAMRQLGATKIILGCTELSVLKEQLKLNDDYIDPLEILILRILTEFNKEKNDENLSLDL